MDSSDHNSVVHGTLVSVRGTGVLIVGESGTGKSMTALALLRAGHQLVADDVVEIQAQKGKLFGRSPDAMFGILEVRGIGFVDARRLFGSHQVLPRVEIAFVVGIGEPNDESLFESSPTLFHAIPKYSTGNRSASDTALFIESLVMITSCNDSLLYANEIAANCSETLVSNAKLCRESNATIEIFRPL